MTDESLFRDHEDGGVGLEVDTLASSHGLSSRLSVRDHLV